ncbi:MAG: tetratricopeptide repeat protein, partial [Phycisphaerales bacterium]|nr:tetratricopeptide repeat protein [Phycisphaerales bacterium]
SGRSCGPSPSDKSAPISLPVAKPPMRRSRMGRWRAGVLIGIHVLIAIHIAHWWTTGETLSPIEPSESMAFSKQGVINAGLIFFVLAIGSTLLLGRWFCGWGCHIVAIQDLSRWLLLRVGIRPKPIRSRLLLVVPLLAALYMFLSPLTYQLLADNLFDHVKDEMHTSAFWRTFPSLIPAILTYVVAGFVAIYVLGAKGFCSTGCPYAGFFGPADQLAPIRIRVTDACNQCGHCTAACTSNVRVHEEVHKFGSVVDPGCMKCLDCVDVCPNDALYVGIGAPAMLTRSRVEGIVKPRATRHGAARAQAGNGAWAALSLFIFACFIVFAGFDRHFTTFPLLEWANIAVMTGLAILLAWMFAGRSERKQDLSLAEDVVFAGLFLIAMLIFRGLYDLVAFLFAMGLAAVIAYVWLHVWLMLRRENLTFHHWRLKRGGSIQRAGWAFLAANAVFGVFALHSAAVQFYSIRAMGLRGAIDARYAADPADPELPNLVDRGLRSAEFVENWSLARFVDSKAGMFWLPETVRKHRLNSQWLTRWHGLRGETDVVEKRLRNQIALDPNWADGRVSLGLTLATEGKLDEARDVLHDGLKHAPDHALLRQNLGVVLAETGDVLGAIEQFRAAIKLDATMNAARVALGRALLVTGQPDEAITVLQEAVDADAEDLDARVFLGQAQVVVGSCDAARDTLTEALRVAGNPPDLASAVEQILANCR